MKDDIGNEDEMVGRCSESPFKDKRSHELRPSALLNRSFEIPRKKNSYIREYR
jgi:hypothetical protein